MEIFSRQDLLVLADQCRPLFKLPNVIGYGLCFKRSGALSVDEPSLAVLVERKVSLGSLKVGDHIPRRMADMPTDVIEIGRPVALTADRVMKQRPAHPGISIGHHHVSAGTFGAVVLDQSTGSPLILSNNHVLANTTNGRDRRAWIGDAVLQPGPYDGGARDDVIAELLRFAPLKTGAAEPDSWLGWLCRLLGRHLPGWDWCREPDHSFNLIDAAVAEPLSEADINAEILGLGRPRGAGEARPGDKVKKSGRSSGVTSGEVRVVNASLDVGMGEVGQVRFVDQIITTPMAEPGDSGSLLLNQDNSAVGLLFAGSSLATVHNRMDNVLSLLGVYFPERGG